MPKSVAETPADQQISSTIGSGPYIFKTDEYRPGEKIVYIKNTKYVPRKEPASGTAGGKIVNVDRLEWVVLNDAQTQTNALVNGVVAEIADEVVVLQLGHMIEKGDKHAVLTRPREPYTRMLLDSRNICKTYATGSWPGKRRSVDAVRDVSLKVRPRETVGIVGESGSGKSTVARCIARLIDPTSGDIHASGRSVAQLKGRSLSPYRRDVQVIFQDPVPLAEPAPDRGRFDHRRPVEFRRGPRHGLEARRRPDAPGAPQARGAAALPERVLGRAAPARLDRARWPASRSSSSRTRPCPPSTCRCRRRS
jgi:hypothetical protein